jgi:hypothetical protein
MGAMRYGQPSSGHAFLRIASIPYFDRKVAVNSISNTTTFTDLQRIHNLSPTFPHAYQQSYPQVDRQYKNSKSALQGLL